MTGLVNLWRLARQSGVVLGLALVAVALLSASYSLSRVAGWIPRSVLAVTLGLIVIQLGLDVRERMRVAPSTAPQAMNPGEPASLRLGSLTEAVAVLWVAGALLALLLFGMTAGSALFACMFLRVYAGESWWSSAGFALALAACVQLLFGLVLQATLYPGWLWQFAG